MESLQNLAGQLAGQGSLITATISGRRKPGETEYSKVQIKPVELKGRLHYQFAYHYPNKVTHRNIPAESFADELMKLFGNVPARIALYGGGRLSGAHQQEIQSEHSEKGPFPQAIGYADA